MKINTKKGFSLIELSIVLIIIGLLVAGITGGASLIKSAELRSTMSEIRNYQTAVNAYYTAVGRLPGTANSSQISFIKSGLAWNEMAVEGVIDNSTSSLPSDDVVAFSSANSPKSKYKGGFYALGYNTQMNQNTIFLFSGTTETPTTLTDANNGTTSANTNVASITIKDAKFIDDKMDNGLIDSGKVYSFTGTNTVGTAGAPVAFIDDKMDNGLKDSGKVYSFTGTNTVGTAGAPVACAYGSTSDVITTQKACSIAIGLGL